jgi:hypothetical protein
MRRLSAQRASARSARPLRAATGENGEREPDAQIVFHFAKMLQALFQMRGGGDVVAFVAFGHSKVDQRFADRA